MIGLVESLARGEPCVAGASLVPAETSPQTTVPVFNPEEALTRCFDSHDMLREMIQCFFDEVKNLIPQMRAALAHGDLLEVGRLGHHMKGTLVYLGASSAQGAAQRVERFCQCRDGSPEKAINALEHECIALKVALVGHPLAADRRG